MCLTKRRGARSCSYRRDIFFWCFKTKARNKFCDLAYHFCCLVQSNRHDKLAKKLVHSRKEPSEGNSVLAPDPRSFFSFLGARVSRVENVDLRVALQLFCFFEKLLLVLYLRL